MDIYYPDVLPRHARITIIEKVICEEKEYLIFGFSDEKLHFSIQFKNEVKKEEPIISQIKTGELLFDVYKAENALIAICQDKDIRYIIQAETLDDIIIITSGMRKG